jgi:hypothetical protein
MAGWISAPVQLHSSREFECDPLTTEECDWYKQRWHFWYEQLPINKEYHQLIYLGQVRSGPCICTADDSIFYVHHWYLHNWPRSVVTSVWISQVSWASHIAETDCSGSILFLPWFPCKATSMEFSTNWNLAVRLGWYRFLLL